MAMATCDGPGSVGAKNRMSPGARSSALTAFPTRYCSRTSRGSGSPNCENTYCVKPLQSNPCGSVPPFLYGAPRSESAAPPRAWGWKAVPGARGVRSSTAAPDAAGGEAGSPGAGSDGARCAGAAPPGAGNGFGVYPDEAQPPEQAAATTRTQSIRTPPVYRRCIDTPTGVGQNSSRLEQTLLLNA